MLNVYTDFDALCRLYHHSAEYVWRGAPPHTAGHIAYAHYRQVGVRFVCMFVVWPYLRRVSACQCCFEVLYGLMWASCCLAYTCSAHACVPVRAG